MGTPTKYTFTPEMHEEIKRVYQAVTGNGEVKELSNRLGFPDGVVSRYAQGQGWIAKAPNAEWSDGELKILEGSAHLQPNSIRKRLKRAGFARSETGIVHKRTRMRHLQNLKGMSARSLSECFGIHPAIVAKWIKEGLLKAKRREGNRTTGQGALWYIKDKWIKDFIRENVSILDLRKVDKYWFVDILTLKAGE